MCQISKMISFSSHCPTSLFCSLVSAFVLNRLDYCNSLLVDLPANLLQRLQSVQNSAGRLIYRLRRSEHITDALLSLHWLRVRERVEYKVAVLMRSTIGRRAFAIAGARVWNALPSDVSSTPSLAVFGRRLKTELFRRCYNVV